jgi:hypothetical protein
MLSYTCRITASLNHKLTSKFKVVLATCNSSGSRLLMKRLRCWNYWKAGKSWFTSCRGLTWLLRWESDIQFPARKLLILAGDPIQLPPTNLVRRLRYFIFPLTIKRIKNRPSSSKVATNDAELSQATGSDENSDSATET